MAKSGGDMKVSGKRQKKNRARARIRAMARTRAVVNQFELEHLGVSDCAIGGGGISCFRWRAV